MKNPGVGNQKFYLASLFKIVRMVLLLFANVQTLLYQDKLPEIILVDSMI